MGSRTTRLDRAGASRRNSGRDSRTRNVRRLAEVAVLAVLATFAVVPGASATMNHDPVAEDFAIYTDGAGAVMVPFAGHFTDPDVEPAYVTSTSEPAQGFFMYFQEDLGYDPFSSENVPDQFTYTVSDGHGGSATATVYVNQPVRTVKSPQTIDITAFPSSIRVGVPTGLTATASATPVTMSVASGQPCSITGVTVTATGVGTCTVDLAQAGDATYDSAEAHVAIPVVKGAQSITVTPPEDTMVGDSVTLDGQVFLNDDLLPAEREVTYAVVAESSGVCEVSSTGVVSTFGLGTCAVFLDSPADDAYDAAEQQMVSFEVVRGTQAITASTPDSTLAGTTVQLDGVVKLNGGTQSSGRTVTYGVAPASSAVCSVSELGLVSALTGGSCTITLDRAADELYDAAAQKTVTFSVTKKAQTITVAEESPASVRVDASRDLSATASSGLTPMTYSVGLEENHCSVTSTGTVTGRAVGSCTVLVDQAGNGVWAAAPQAETLVQVGQAVQSISVTTPDPVVVDTPVTLDGEVLVNGQSSSRPVTYTSLTEPVCTVDGADVTTLTGGTCKVRLTQPGDENYAAAERVDVQFTVLKRTQVISVAEDIPGTLLVQDTTELDGASSLNGYPVSYATDLEENACAVDSSGQVSAVHQGSCTVTVTQAGDDRAEAAEPVTVVIEIDKHTKAISVTTPDSVLVGTLVTLDGAVSFDGSDEVSDLTRPSYTSLSEGVCTVSETGVVTTHTAGLCSVKLQSPGDGYAYAAEPVTVSFTVAPLAQTIGFSAPEQLLAGPAAYALAPTATSGLSAALSVVSGDCHLTGADLVATVATTCTVEATQAGSSVYAAAPARRATIVFVLPHDDAFSVAGNAPVSSLDVAANDPAGLTVTAVGAASHGTSTLAGQSVDYVPAAGFHGTDTFDYTVRDTSGRTATGTVVVTVGNLLPTLANATTSQVAGTSTVVTLTANDPNAGDTLTLSAPSTPAGVRATVSGKTVTLTVAPRISGLVKIPVRVSDGAGGVATATITDRVTPDAVDSASRVLAHGDTVVRWSAAPTDGARYAVRVDGTQVCLTRATSCTVDGPVGPRKRVTVRVLGGDDTVSAPTAATPAGHGQVLLGTVYFAAGDDIMTAAQQRQLAAVARRIGALGFGTAQVSGYTDSDGGAAYNLALSHRRTQTVARFLRGHGGIGSEQSWFGVQNPAATNVSDSGKALNRRVEILVAY